MGTYYNFEAKEREENRSVGGRWGTPMAKYGPPRKYTLLRGKMMGSSMARPTWVIGRHFDKRGGRHSFLAFFII